MKLYLIFYILAVVKGWPSGIIDFLPNKSSWLVPDKNLNFYWESRDTARREIDELLKRELDIRYYLYTVNNPTEPQELFIDNLGILRQSNFNNYLPTRIIIHGYQSYAFGEVCTLMRDAYIATGYCNVICVGWDTISNASYVAATLLTPTVGKNIGLFIKFLNEKGEMPINKLTVIGHSLGGQLSGFVGKAFQEITGGKLDVIIGLDVARPLFSEAPSWAHINKDDANFVMSVHTNGGMLGFLRPVGHVSFYVNGGSYQPRCGTQNISWCSHISAYIYHAESVRYNNFPSMTCTSPVSNLGFCLYLVRGVNMSLKDCYGIEGLFYVPVNPSAPYGTAPIQ